MTFSVPCQQRHRNNKENKKQQLTTALHAVLFITILFLHSRVRVVPVGLPYRQPTATLQISTCILRTTTSMTKISISDKTSKHTL